MQKYKIVNNKDKFETFFVDHAFDSAISQIKRFLNRNGKDGYTVYQKNPSNYIFKDENGNSNLWIKITL